MNTSREPYLARTPPFCQVDGRAFPSEKWYVEASGRVVKSAL